MLAYAPAEEKIFWLESGAGNPGAMTASMGV